MSTDYNSKADIDDDVDQPTSHAVDKYGARPLNLDDAATRTVSAKESIRKKLEEDIQNFISSGGSVQVVENNVIADPPRKPVSNYGSRPI